jgi:hypothetical protein
VIITGDLSSMRDRLYESYASQRGGTDSAKSTRLIYRRDIQPLRPPPLQGAATEIRTIRKPISGLFKLVLAAVTGAVRGQVMAQSPTFAVRRTGTNTETS